MITPTPHNALADRRSRHGYPVRDDAAEVSGLRATIELAPVGIAQFDTRGRFLLVNSRLCTILGYSHAELLAMTFHDITFPEDQQACVASNEQLVAGELQNYQREKRFIRRDGAAVWTRVTVSAVRQPGGDLAFFVGVAEDISEEKAHAEARSASQLQSERLLALEHRARTRAERANRMREDVLAVVAHDLRNPLHTLQLSALAMAEPGMTAEKRAEQADLIQRVVESMDRLIGELQDIGRIEAGSFPIAKAPVRMEELLDEIMSMFQPQADESGVTLAREDDFSLGVVMCDRDQLMRVLSNLVGNAVKFTTAPGRVFIRASRTGDSAEISVSDTGPGIPREDLAHVFDRFWQADRTKRFGTGLGLVIAKGIVESHGGRIWAESTVGRGSIFHFTLPAG